jgi:hypothetical protein
VFSAFFQCGASHAHVQFNQLFNASKGFGGQAKKGFHIGSLGSEDLFNGQAHINLLKK